MLRYTVKRLLQLAVALLGLSLLLFAWFKALPGGPENRMLPDNATDQQREALRQALGLDEPIWSQYGEFLSRMVHLDFGTSLSSGRPIGTELAERLPATIELSMWAIVIAVGIGIPLGYLAARRRGTWLDFGAVAGSLVGICIPVFFLAAMLKVVFAQELGWLPTTFRLSPGLTYTEITGLRVLDGLLTGEFDVVWDAARHLMLPAIALASIPLAVIVRITRASVLEVVGEDYVRTADAKGLKQTTIRGRHIMKNAMLPIVTVIGLLLGSLFAGAVLTESVFAFGGIGSFVYQATTERDYPALMGFILVIAVSYVVLNLIVDLSYGFLDPRVRVRK
ncbi:ABC transporter permease [Glycomyces buryatensis]|uniref:ABC transporter permease n=1 Tax=Glycomyces buryatensis TaxID=2570927 RepID=A0A4S8QIR4_9ACTN|nr:ABC transporter permease [Glycomyces buryatensis]THV41269.1 ABC transporter permease [Glycomyces buryatensis]